MKAGWTDEAGLTLVEILVAIAVIMIGLVALMQWFPLGTQGVEAGRQQSTAVFLAEQKIEQIKAFGLTTQAFFDTIVPGGGCFGAGQPCAPDAYNTIPGYAGYRRQVTVTVPVTVPPNTRRVVQVDVFYRPIASTGVGVVGGTGETQVMLATMIVTRW